MELIPNFVRNHKEIVEYCLRNTDKFIPRRLDQGHQGPLPISSKFSSFKNESMDDNFIDLIFKDCDFDPDLRDLYYFIQIQKYNPGDFIVPHRDNYNVRKLHLITLTTSEVDGLILENGIDLIKIYDLAGQKIESDLNDWHWVDPVKDLRFSLVIGE